MLTVLSDGGRTAQDDEGALVKGGSAIPGRGQAYAFSLRELAVVQRQCSRGEPERNRRSLVQSDIARDLFRSMN